MAVAGLYFPQFGGKINSGPFSQKPEAISSGHAILRANAKIR
jgi:hypothetical protein